MNKELLAQIEKEARDYQEGRWNCGSFAEQEAPFIAGAKFMYELRVKGLEEELNDVYRDRSLLDDCNIELNFRVKDFQVKLAALEADTKQRIEMRKVLEDQKQRLIEERDFVVTQNKILREGLKDIGGSDESYESCCRTGESFVDFMGLARETLAKADNLKKHSVSQNEQNSENVHNGKQDKKENGG